MNLDLDLTLTLTPTLTPALTLTLTSTVTLTLTLTRALDSDLDLGPEQEGAAATSGVLEFIEALKDDTDEETRAAAQARVSSKT